MVFKSNNLYVFLEIDFGRSSFKMKILKHCLNNNCFNKWPIYTYLSFWLNNKKGHFVASSPVKKRKQTPLNFYQIKGKSTSNK